MSAVIVPLKAAPAGLVPLAEAAQSYAEASRAAATVRGYSSDWKQFRLWCGARGLDPLPADPATVVLYLSDRAGALSTATLQRHLTAISQAHAAAGHPSPTKTEPVRRVWSGIRRTHGTASTGKSPLLTADVRAMVQHLGDSPLDVRDRALLLVTYAGALRRSEVVALDVEDVTLTGEGLLVHLRRSKTDQEGKGHLVGVPYGSDPATCPVRAYLRHLDVNGITTGPVFRVMETGERLSGRSAATRVQRLAGLIGKDVRTIGAHSLRAGLITSAVTAGVREHDVMRHSRHRSINVFRSYVRKVDCWADNAAVAVGL